MNRALALSCQHHHTLRAMSRRRESSSGTSATAMMGRKKGVAEHEVESTRASAACPQSQLIRVEAFLKAISKALT